ncbi:MAG: hypothetical protein AABY22_07295 [Nanoarchaeota archaeon]
MKTSKNIMLSEIRTALADYIKSEGCSCCRNIDEHNIAEEKLGKLLKIPKFKDGSGYDFWKYVSKK